MSDRVPDQANDRATLFVHRLAARLLVVDGGPGPWRRRAGTLPGDVRFGAADDRALALLNVAVGNAPWTPGLELIVGPLVLRAEGAVTLACDGELRIGDDVMVPGRVQHLQRGQRLQVAPRALIATIAIAGGVDAMPGTTFSRDDAIPLDLRRVESPDDDDNGAVDRARSLAAAPAGDDDAPLRVVPGQERAAFDDEAWQTFLTTPWTVSPTSSRLGVRLVGPVLPTPAASLTTSPTWTGAVQVPPSGQPIVLGVDSRTTGGYPRLAHVIAVDRFRLGRARPGSTLRFAGVDLDEARALRRDRERSLRWAR